MDPLTINFSRIETFGLFVGNEPPPVVSSLFFLLNILFGSLEWVLALVFTLLLFSFFLFLDLMVSVFKLIGLGSPCNFRKRPHALQRTVPCSSLLHRGVLTVKQFWHVGWSSPSQSSTPAAAESVGEGSFNESLSTILLYII
ncbi:hypothetical protein RM700_269 [Saccharomyces cerevisiae synthetic construct]|uniref:Putative uncharacterized protein YKR033C n=2 Tax=Saccharomyces cerevisiae TaxID=4932 RepID=YK13_YEAST|nr:RecName: Full=Putative uncharacterized protein YKR033C [Saccharomyces cerevisiae S288C]AAS56687.1 YKR033C [Saccharomyces cerevisiae]WNV94351.1 hypothetical protein RM700_269 [Saccharomyces cerevisiae synthetic construct]CAY81113.1 EC1118_1K5_2927p [Saccharomyces cerevisiae EC1118]KZV09974.1 hypothetical protein WN66_04030 [Saccharomyces cerevisiae]CAA82105.1 unnamed protein product [Saccharomyces cerevisiae]